MYPAKGLKLLLISVVLPVGALVSLWAWDSDRAPSHALLPFEAQPTLNTAGHNEAEAEHSSFAPVSPLTHGVESHGIQIRTGEPLRTPASAPGHHESMSE